MYGIPERQILRSRVETAAACFVFVGAEAFRIGSNLHGGWGAACLGVELA